VSTPSPPPRGGLISNAPTGRTLLHQGEGLARGDSIGRYLVLDKLGEGGMGLVFAAYDPELNRRIALKLLRPALRGASSPAQARLMREAQAMARVSHPNVISVFDVGTHGTHQVFVAMEFVDGGTLNDWLVKEKRSVREILKLFIEAGRGLAAAHAAGLVHRDFKPENVLLGTDGRVRVTDFGLARLTSDDVELGAPEADQPTRKGADLARLTQAGAVVGTPLFMSPEQHRRQTPDSRSDQFNFCASLYWAIYGSSPLLGLERIYLRRMTDDDHTSTVDTVTAAAEAEGPTLVKEFPKEPKIPANVKRALVRGLSLDPTRRFPSMEDLLRELARDPRVQQRRWGAVAAGALVVTGAAFGYQRILSGRGQLCQGAERKLEGIWGPAVREQIEKAFVATGSPDAIPMVGRVSEVLDQYSRDWVAMHTDACEATRVRGEQTDQVLSLRMICLDRQLQQLSALTKILSTADDRKTVERSFDAANALTGLRGCADVAALTSPVALPDDEATRARAEALSRRLAEAKALMDSGQYARGKDVAAAAVNDARSLGYAPMTAEALEIYSMLLDFTGESLRAEGLLLESVVEAERSRHDLEKARALMRLVRVVGYSQGHSKEALQWAALAQATVQRVSSPEVEIELLGEIGNTLLVQGKYTEAAASFAKAAEMAEREFGPAHQRTNRILGNWASALQKTGEYQKALELLNRVAANYEKIFGPRHLFMARIRNNIAQVLRGKGDYKKAYEEIQEALSINVAAVGADNPRVALDLDILATILQADGLYAEALAEAQRSLAIRSRSLKPDHLYLSFSLENIGQAYLGLRQPQAALAPLERAVQIREQHRQEDSEIAEARFALGRALWELGRDRRRARQLVEKAHKGYQAGHDAAGEEMVKKWLEDHPATAVAGRR
jgi:tetratricopeptide (TPR) repeat protein